MTTTDTSTDIAEDAANTAETIADDADGVGHDHAIGIVGQPHG